MQMVDLMVVVVEEDLLLLLLEGDLKYSVLKQ